MDEEGEWSSAGEESDGEGDEGGAAPAEDDAKMKGDSELGDDDARHVVGALSAEEERDYDRMMDGVEDGSVLGDAVKQQVSDAESNLLLFDHLIKGYLSNEGG